MGRPARGFGWHRLRVSPHIYNDEADVVAFLRVFRGRV